MKVPIWKLNFLYGAVGFSIFIEAVGAELQFEISNENIRPEFAAIRDYFARVLRKKMISAEIKVMYTSEGIISAEAASDDIASINQQMIEAVRFEFVKREIFKGTKDDGTGLLTMEALLGEPGVNSGFYNSEAKLLDDILSVRKSRHFLQLKYLSARHEAMILKLRFVLHPFSFIFLLGGERQYHIVWETLDTEDATYVWHADKTRASLRARINEVQMALSEIKRSGRQEFLVRDQEGFSKIVHDYSNEKKGFVAWKAALEEAIA
jgi:hypothetical protein